jgi:hypothetical protein
LSLAISESCCHLSLANSCDNPIFPQLEQFAIVNN